MRSASLLFLFAAAALLLAVPAFAQQAYDSAFTVPTSDQTSNFGDSSGTATLPALTVRSDGSNTGSSSVTVSKAAATGLPSGVTASPISNGDKNAVADGNSFQISVTSGDPIIITSVQFKLSSAQLSAYNADSSINQLFILFSSAANVWSTLSYTISSDVITVTPSGAGTIVFAIGPIIASADVVPGAPATEFQTATGLSQQIFLTGSNQTALGVFAGQLDSTQIRVTSVDNGANTYPTTADGGSILSQIYTFQFSNDPTFNGVGLMFSLASVLADQRSGVFWASSPTSSPSWTALSSTDTSSGVYAASIVTSKTDFTTLAFAAFQRPVEASSSSSTAGDVSSSTAEESSSTADASSSTAEESSSSADVSSSTSDEQSSSSAEEVASSSTGVESSSTSDESFSSSASASSSTSEEVASSSSTAETPSAVSSSAAESSSTAESPAAESSSATDASVSSSAGEASSTAGVPPPPPPSSSGTPPPVVVSSSSGSAGSATSSAASSSSASSPATTTSSSTASSNIPSGTAAGATSSSSTGSTSTATTTLTIIGTFPGDIATYTNATIRDPFVAGIKSDLANITTVPIAKVLVGDFEAGSVVVPVIVQDVPSNIAQGILSGAIPLTGSTLSKGTFKFVDVNSLSSSSGINLGDFNAASKQASMGVAALVALFAAVMAIMQ